MDWRLSVSGFCIKAGSGSCRPHARTNRIAPALWKALVGVLFFASVSSVHPAQAANTRATRLAGPLMATVVRVVDGDTIWVEVQTWLHQSVTSLVRIKGIDAPELHGHCASEKAAARRAQKALSRLAPVGSVIQISDIEAGKYANRVIAVVKTANGTDVAEHLLEAHLARAYDGGKRAGWCR